MSKDIEFNDLTQTAARNDITQNEINTAMNSLMSRSVESVLSTPPAFSEGNVYIIGAAPTDAWSARSEHDIAISLAAKWVFATPSAGWLMWQKSTSKWRSFSGSAWADETAANFDQVAADVDITDNSNGTASATIADLNVTDNTNATADTTIEDVSTVVTGVDGTGNNAASKVDVDSRLAGIDRNFADIVQREDVMQDAIASLAAELNDLRAKMRTADILAT